MFVYKPGITSEDDIIEDIINELIKPEWAGGCLQVPDWCRTPENYSYDYHMEQMVRERMYQHKVAIRCTGSNQPQTAIMITTKGIKVGRSGGWKAYLKIEAERKLADIKKRADDERAKLERDRLEAERASLDRKKSMLEVEKLNYELENRELTEKVQHLTALNLRIQNADYIGKWVATILSALITFASSVFVETKFQWISKLAKALVKISSATD